MLKNIKARYLWIAFVISIIVCMLAIWGCSYLNNKMATMIILVALFILSGFIFQAAIGKSMIIKQEKRKYNPVNNEAISIESTIATLRDNKFSSHKMSFGTSFTKIVNDTVLKATFINDTNKYFNSNNDEIASNVAGINEAKRFLGFEIFSDVNEQLLSKIGDFSFNGEKVHFEGFYLTEEYLVEANYLEPYDEMKESYDYFKDLLNIKRVDNNGKEKE